MSMTPPTSNPNRDRAAAAVAADHAEIADGQSKLHSLVPTAPGWYRDQNNQVWSFDGSLWTWHQTDSMVNYGAWNDITVYVPFESIEEPLSLMSPTEALDQANTDLSSAQSEVAAAEAAIAAADSGDSGDSGSGA